MRVTALGLIIVFGFATVPALEAQGRGRGNRGVPPGHLPAPGECRVWYDGVPPGQQPPPTSCREAERIALRARTARVIYGDDRWNRDPRVRGDRGRIDDRRTRRRAVPRTERYPTTDRYPDSRYPDRRRDVRYESAAFQSGYRDGLVKGREDVRDRDRFDPSRHSWYRSADRDYDRRFGSRDEYRAEYRAGFLRGYENAYEGRAPSDGRRPRIIRER